MSINLNVLSNLQTTPNGFKYGQRSKKNIKSVAMPLQELASLALKLSDTDIAVICGKRTLAEQKQLVAKGASRTMRSKHLTGRAIDVRACGVSHLSDIDQCLTMAPYFILAARLLNIKVRWGLCWTIHDIRYIDNPKAVYDNLPHGSFIDAYHYELSSGN